MKAKRLFALLLSFVMVISMLPGTALAANEPAVELKIAEETLADKAGLSVELVVDSGANNASTISTIYAYDMALLELVDSTGAALAVTEEVKISPKAAIARYEDADLGSDTWSLKNVYVATAGNDVGLVHAAFIANPELCEAYYSNKGIPMDNAAVVKMFFALKDGASAYEAAESIRLATAAEAEKMGQNEAAMFVDGVDNAFILNSLDVDDTAGFELPVSHSIEAPHVHAWGEPAVTEPTCTEKGKKVYTCACGETKTEETAALGHTFAEGTCSVCGAADPDYVAPQPPVEEPVVETVEAVYIGVKDFLTLDTDNVKEDDFIHLFFVDGETVEADVEGGDPYVIENQLRGGYIYNVTFTDGVVTAVEEAEVATGVAGDFDLAGKALYEIESPIQPEGAVVNVVDTIADDATVKVTANAAYKAFVAEPYEAPVTATPGEKTLKNFLATALAPVGTALYVYGGGWDWQDGSGYASSNQSMTIGLPQEWIDFFQANDETYHFKQTDASGSHANSVYTSNRGWNQYYWAGIDCSGYVGWVTWNTLHTENGVKGVDEGYVGSSTSQAKNMAQKGWGTLDQGDVDADGKHTYANATFNVGDVFSMNGHVWICLGTCEDGSILFAHSTPNTSNGAGAQLSAIGESKDCQAYQLASYYMETYYPQWGERYDALLMSFTGYTNTTGSNAGKFTWDLENGILTDEEGFAAMTPVEIMGELYGDDFVPGEEEEPEQPEQPEEPVVLDGKFEAVYIGVKDFLTLDTDEVAEDDFIHLFFVGGETVEADVAGGDPYVIENKLMGGYIYDVTFEDGVVVDAELAKVETGVAADFDLSDKPFYEIESPLQPTGAVVYEIEGLFDEDTVKVTKNAVYKTFVAEEYTAPVAGKPGKTTLKNFLTTALMPVGTALYVYGGCWDWQDDASSNQSITIGIPQEWVDFFQANDTTYHYKQKDASGSHANSVYTSNRGWNQYYWAGVDCSAYVAWTTWNTLNAKDGEFGKDGYVMSSTNMAYNFADYGWGTYDEGARVLNEDGTIYKDGDGDTYRLFDVADFKVGDIFSDNGHVWICLGVCEDGSMVFMHSTPSTSKDGLGEGGGIQISALDLQDRETCEAAELADYYMTTYYPQWAERYDAVTKGESYIKVYDTGMPGTDGYRFRKAGRFSWDLEDGILSDPDDYSKLTPAEILADIFAEEEEKDEPSAPSKPSTPSKPSKPEVEEPETPAEPEQPEQPEVPAEKPVFEDVPADHWAADAIEKVVEKGLFKGVEADKFAPSADITREQIMTVLARAAGADTEGDALAKGMAWAKENGISDGTNGKGKVTREQLVTMLYRVAVKNGMDVTVSGAALDFADAASISAFAQEAMQWAIENGIINGMSETTLAPQGPATRAQIAIIMVRFENL